MNKSPDTSTFAYGVVFGNTGAHIIDAIVTDDGRMVINIVASLFAALVLGGLVWAFSNFSISRRSKDTNDAS